MYIASAEGRLFATSWGDTHTGDPIVLFHDSLGCVGLWRDFPEQLSLAAGRRVIAYDRLGFGQSDPHPGKLSNTFIRDESRHAIPALRDAFGFDAFVAFGHSVGGGMAIACAANFPSHCRALITESAQTFVEDRTLNGIREAQQVFEREGQLKRLEKYHGDKARWVLSAWTDTWLAPDFASWSLDDELPLVTCPLLAIHGDQDEFGSIRHPQRIGSLTSGPAVVEVLAGCGHVPHREKAELVLVLITTFLSPPIGPTV